MLKEVIIHIGMHKTGTTTIQRVFNKFDDGKTFYANWGSPNHSMPANIGFSKNYLKISALLREGKSKEEISALRVKHRAQLEKELSRPDRERMVISGEEISFIDPAGLKDFQSFVAKYAEKQTIVIYLRDPLSYAASALQQRTRSGLTNVKMLRSPDYKKRLEKFCNVYGKSNVIAREFNREVMLDGDVVTDFADFLNIPHPKPGFKNQNESMSLEAVKLLIVFSRHCHVLNGDGLTYYAMIAFRALIVNKFANGQKIDKSRFLAIADYSNAEYLEAKFGIKFVKPEGSKIGTIENLNKWLGDTRGMDLTPLDELLAERGIEGMFDTTSQKLVRLYYSCLIGQHEVEKKGKFLPLIVKNKARSMIYRSQFLEKNARRMHRKVTTWAGRNRS